MFVSHRHRFIFLKTEKTAGTSLENLFARLHGIEIASDQAFAILENDAAMVARSRENPAQALYNHMSAEEVRAALPDLFAAYRHVTAVRNPFSKAVSKYFFERRDIARAAADLQRADVISGFRDWLSERRNFTASDRNKYLLDGEPCIDFVIFYEDLAGQTAAFCDAVGLGAAYGALPQEKGNIRPRAIDIAEFFTPALAAEVCERFDYEFALFGYSNDPADHAALPRAALQDAVAGAAAGE